MWVGLVGHCIGVVYATGGVCASFTLADDSFLIWSNMAALRGQFRGLANDRNLRRFLVQARPTGRQLGTGSYGTVEEVIENGNLWVLTSHAPV